MTRLLHVQFEDKTSYGITEAMGYLVGNSSLALICVCFALKHEDWSRLMEVLMDFQKFGKPPKSIKLQTNGTKVGIAFCTTLYCSVIIYGTLQVLLEETCEKV